MMELRVEGLDFDCCFVVLLCFVEHVLVEVDVSPVVVDCWVITVVLNGLVEIRDCILPQIYVIKR